MDFTKLRRKFDLERQKPVKVTACTKVVTMTLIMVPEIGIKLIDLSDFERSYLSHRYEIVGGPDDGKKVLLLHWMPENKFKNIPSDQEEFGYEARPKIMYHGELHIFTIGFLMGCLVADRDHKMHAYFDTLIKQHQD